LIVKIIDAINRIFVANFNMHRFFFISDPYGKLRFKLINSIRQLVASVNALLGMINVIVFAPERIENE